VEIFYTRYDRLLRSPRPHSLDLIHCTDFPVSYQTKGRNVWTSDRKYCQFGILLMDLRHIFALWSTPPYRFPTSISKHTVRLLRHRLNHSKTVTSSNNHRCYKEICNFVFCIVDSFSVQNKRYDCMGDQNTAHQFSMLFVPLKSHSYFDLLYCCIIIRCR